MLTCPANGQKLRGSACPVKACLFNVANIPLDLPPIETGCMLIAASAGGDDPIARLRYLIGNDGRKFMTLQAAVKHISSFGAALRDYARMFEFMPPSANVCPNCGYTADGFSGRCVSLATCSERRDAVARALSLFDSGGEAAAPMPAQVWEAVLARQDAHLPFDLRDTLRGLAGHSDRPHEMHIDP